MPVMLSLHERFLLEAWLPKESKPGELQTDARSVVATGGTLDIAGVRDRLAKVRKCLADLRTPRSTLDTRPPIGRGFTSRKPGGITLSWLSPWEEAWLVVDRIRLAGEFENPVGAAQTLQDLLRTSLVNAVAITVLCLDSAAEGQRFATAVAVDPTCAAYDRAWLQWLGGDWAVDLSRNLTDELSGETPKKALQAALAKDWSQVESLLPKSFRKPFPKPIQASGTRMHGQALAQLASNARHGQPERAVIESSFAQLFRFFGFEKESAWWDGREVMTRLPLLALYARGLDQDIGGAHLLHAQRRFIEHVMAPPPRTFVGPPEVVAAVEKLEGALAAAAQDGRCLNISLTGDGSVYTVT